MSAITPDAKSVPVDGQSHWCDRRTLLGKRCRNVVSNNSERCEAGHPNAIRFPGTRLIGPTRNLNFDASALSPTFETDGLVAEDAHRQALPCYSGLVPNCSEDLVFRGLVHQVSDPAVLELLDKGHETVYTGFDPTADSLHVGNLLQLCTLARLQCYGNRPIVVIGGGTGLIGDPGGKDEERPALSLKEVSANLKRIRANVGRQFERFIDFSGARADETYARVVDNSDWLVSLRSIDFLCDVGRYFPVSQILGKESVRARLDKPGGGISYAEFSYMLYQAYDFLHLFDEFGCRIQVGGSDQWGNITMGVDLIRRARGKTAYALTTPLVTRPDGTKFGKSESDALYLDAKRTSPYTLYQYFIRTDDSVVGQCLRYFTFLGHDKITDLDEATAEYPERRAAQRALAREVVTFVHGQEEATKVEHAAKVLYTEDIATLDEQTLLDVFADVPSSSMSRSQLDGRGLYVAEAFVSTELVPSKTVARITVTQGGAYVNNRRVELDTLITREDLIAGHYIILRRGQKELRLVRFV